MVHIHEIVCVCSGEQKISDVTLRSSLTSYNKNAKALSKW